jgi:hypothetical protein
MTCPGDLEKPREPLKNMGRTKNKNKTKIKKKKKRAGKDHRPVMALVILPGLFRRLSDI